jgi:hypothetical protein
MEMVGLVGKETKTKRKKIGDMGHTCTHGTPLSPDGDP